jgi:hypothetical protein
MMVGPRTAESTAEEDDDPTREHLRATVDWSLEVDNVDMANIEFKDDGAVGPHIQLMGEVYNLSGLSEDRYKKARKVLDGRIEDQDVGEMYWTVEVSATVEEHQKLVEELLSEVYDTSPDELETISRSTVEQRDPEENTADISSATCENCGTEFKELEFVMESFGAEFYTSHQVETSLGDEAVDMILTEGNWECKDCF